MTILKIYLVVSAALVLIANNFWHIFREDYSWWLVPVLILAIFLCLLVLQFIVFGLMIITTNTKKEPGRDENFFRFLIKHSLPIIVGLAKVKIKAQGLEKMPEDKKVLLVCNHQHDFDPAVIINCFPDATLSFIGKKDIKDEMPFIAKAMHRFSCLFIDRENDREAAKTIITAIKYLKDDRCSIALFPEGYCSKDDNLLPFRNGSLKIAIKAKVPVAVCVINNTKQIPKQIFRKITEVDFRLLDVIYPEVYENMNTAELGDLIYEKMQTALNEIRNSEFGISN